MGGTIWNKIGVMWIIVNVHLLCPWFILPSPPSVYYAWNVHTWTLTSTVTCYWFYLDFTFLRYNACLHLTLGMCSDLLCYPRREQPAPTLCGRLRTDRGLVTVAFSLRLRADFALLFVLPACSLTQVPVSFLPMTRPLRLRNSLEPLLFVRFCFTLWGYVTGCMSVQEYYDFQVD